MTPGLHGPLCNFLQHDPHPRKGVVGFRGSFKSSVVLAYAAWRGLHAPELGLGDWSCMWIEQKWDNAVDHHRMLQLKFGKEGGRIIKTDQVEILWEMYWDRLPPNLAGWTDSQSLLIRTDPTAEPFFTVGSLDSKLEGKHRSEILCDDLEGADAEKADAPNVESWRFIEERAPDLLDDPVTGKIVVSGTPHGGDPMVWKIREADAGGTLDNGNRKFWHLWWKPILNEAGETNWPERRPQEWCERERERGQFSARAQRRWDMQLMLRKASLGGREFDLKTLREIAWEAELAPGAGGSAKVVWRYPTLEYEKLESGEIRAKENMNPREDGMGETFMRPANVVPFDTPVDATRGLRGAGGDDNQPAGGAYAPRMLLLAEEASKRLIRKEVDRVSKAAKKYAGNAAGWEQWCAEFYEAHGPDVARTLCVAEATGVAYAERQKNELLGRGVAVTEAWMADRPAELAKVALEGA